MVSLNDVKIALRVSDNAFDKEIEMYIDAAIADLKRVGVKDKYLEPFASSPLVDMAITTYCKAHFGYDNEDAVRLENSYRQMVIDLLNSTANERVNE